MPPSGRARPFGVGAWVNLELTLVLVNQSSNNVNFLLVLLYREIRDIGVRWEFFGLKAMPVRMQLQDDIERVTNARGLLF